jgi:hypothetical protein
MGKYDLKVSMDSEFGVKELQKKQYGHKKAIESDWTEENNFGSDKYISEEFQEFLKNPNFFFKIPKKVDSRIHLFTKEELSICIDLFEITSDQKFIKIKDSGTYSPYKMGVFLT